MIIFLGFVALMAIVVAGAAAVVFGLVMMITDIVSG